MNRVLLYALALTSCPLLAGQGAVIALNPKVTFQKMTGWEATTLIEPAGSPAFPLFKDRLFDLAVNDLGLNRLRLEVRSGVENTRDFWTPYFNKQITAKEFRCARYSNVNDNDDPFTINWNGFHFSEMDRIFEEIVVPIKKRVEARGEKFYLNVNYVAFYRQMTEPGCPPDLKYLHDNPEEYAEFVLATYIHLKQKYGIVPDAWEFHLEPDNTPYWRGRTIGEALVAAARRLEKNGFHAAFIAPSPTDMSNAVPYFDDMVKIPGVLKYLEEFCYHRYRGVSDDNLRHIAERAATYKVKTSMLEHIGSGYEDLHKDLVIAGNSAWAQYYLATLSYGSKKQVDDWTDSIILKPLLEAAKSGDQKRIDDVASAVRSSVWSKVRNTPERGLAYYTIDDGDPKNPKVTMNPQTKLLRQYFKYVRPGAVRIEATTADAAIEPVAFINANGGYVVVVKALQARSFSIQGLPAGTYGIKYTTENRYNVDLPEVSIRADQSLTTSIPEAGALTVYGGSGQSR